MTGNEREGCLRVRIDGDALDERWVLPPGREVASAGEALALVLAAWQANPLPSSAHIWRVVDIAIVDDADGVLLVRRPDRRVHLVGAGGVGEDLRGLLRPGVDVWRLHDLPPAQTPLQDAAPLLGPPGVRHAHPLRVSEHSRNSPPCPTWVMTFVEDDSS